MLLFVVFAQIPTVANSDKLQNKRLTGEFHVRYTDVSGLTMYEEFE